MEVTSKVLIFHYEGDFGEKDYLSALFLDTSLDLESYLLLPWAIPGEALKQLKNWRKEGRTFDEILLIPWGETYVREEDNIFKYFNLFWKLLNSNGVLKIVMKFPFGSSMTKGDLREMAHDAATSNNYDYGFLAKIFGFVQSMNKPNDGLRIKSGDEKISFWRLWRRDDIREKYSEERKEYMKTAGYKIL